MKSCRMVFYSDYVSDNQLLSTLKNSSLLDKCYIGFYEKTWEGRPHTKASVDHLKNLVGSSEKVEIVSITQKDIGMKSERFEVETSCRNYILDKAKTDGFRICFIQDADEFLIKEEYKIILDNHVPYMLNQGYDCASIRWVHFWKNWNWVLTNENGELAYEWENFIIDLNSDVKFCLGRTLYGNKLWIQEPWFLYHGCYVLSDKEVYEKITTCNRFEFLEIDLNSWYEEKWLKWTPENENLYPSKNPSFWKKAIKYNGPLPKECII